MVDLRQRSRGISEQPQCQGPKRQGCRTHVMAKAHRQRTMRGRIVKREGAIEMGEPFGGVAQTEQGRAEQTMTDHDGCCSLLLLRESEELGRKRARSVAVESDELRYEKAV